MQAYAFVQNEEPRRNVMLDTISQEKTALAVNHGAEKKRPDDTEKDKRRCDYYFKISHTREKLWKLHGRPILARGGRDGIKTSSCSF